MQKEMLNSQINHFLTTRPPLTYFIFYFLSNNWSSQRDKAMCRHCTNRPIRLQFNSMDPMQSNLTQEVNSGTSNRRFSTNSFPTALKSFKAPCCAGNARPAVQYWHQNANMALGFSQVFIRGGARERCKHVRCEMLQRGIIKDRGTSCVRGLPRVGGRLVGEI